MNKPILILNDQGGGVMYISYDTVGTILSYNISHAHAPIVLIEGENHEAEENRSDHSA